MQLDYSYPEVLDLLVPAMNTASANPAVTMAKQKGVLTMIVMKALGRSGSVSTTHQEIITREWIMIVDMSGTSVKAALKLTTTTAPS